MITTLKCYRFERYKTAEDGSPRYAFAGYLTAYRYFAYPENQRPRISQMLILPPFQRKGLGAKLLDSVCKSFWNRNKVVDITGEKVILGHVAFKNPQGFDL